MGENKASIGPALDPREQSWPDKGSEGDDTEVWAYIFVVLPFWDERKSCSK